MWEAIGGAPAALLDGTDAKYARWARARLRSGRLVGFIAESGETPVGSGCVWLQDVQPRPHLPGPHQPYLMSMWTEADWRGHGVATRIVQAAMAWARERGYPRLLLHASDAGRPVYEKLGFTASREMVVQLTPAAPAPTQREAPPR